MDIKLKLDTCYITLNLDILDETSYFERDVKYITRNTFEWIIPKISNKGIIQ